ncbi:hypothetical protein AB0F72_21460 [Actinoplanes sp. NPDC023936]|uniref:hypothetical protein n=1 Tax=Actinoplanes sp. NPDC023936 TaxID=3154910 RepID=UPI0033D89190
MKNSPLVAAAAVVLLVGVRAQRSRHQRSLHPAGRSFAGRLEVWGLPASTGSDLLDKPGDYPVTVRVSKGLGSRGSRPDVLGLAIRIPGRDTDLLLSTAGTGRLTRHLPMPRRRFDAHYGTITAYRTGTDRKIYLAAAPLRSAPPLGGTLDTVTAAALTGHAQLVLFADDQPFGRVSFGPLLPSSTDEELAFDPIRNSTPDLRPTGSIHGSRALAYRLSQWWRGRPNPA